MGTAYLLSVMSAGACKGVCVLDSALADVSKPAALVGSEELPVLAGAVQAVRRSADRIRSVVNFFMERYLSLLIF